MFSKFWWGFKEGNRKISWIKWQDLYLTKSHGGFDFKDLSVFNQTLIAKQAWKVLLEQDSLIARLLKAKYFRNVDFLQASLKSGSSYIWRSIIWGRSLLMKGLRWKVGNGRSIRIFKDRWLPRPNAFTPITPDPGNDLRVAALIDCDPPGWNLEMLDQTLFPVDMEAVLSIPIKPHGWP
ncbi:hypothetical protein Dsin_028860 [Dipteronia sinensis]|uniref:Uncharacterized protein n=1 Tax=Dipteronia sinensis TaxID=43782 RepID=A0AAD9ZRY5_9ROSI|nr:hypothetical protein Dsin_028860 [Dipteronia sinensis]